MTTPLMSNVHLYSEGNGKAIVLAKQQYVYIHAQTHSVCVINIEGDGELEGGGGEFSQCRIKLQLKC